MRWWILGALLGTLATAIQPQLQSGQAQRLAVVVGLVVMPAPGVLRSVSGFLIAHAWAAADGQRILRQRLPEPCVRRPLVVEGHVRGLPRRSQLREGVPRQRFEFQVERLSPAVCSGPQRLLLSFYGDERIEPGSYRRFAVRLRRPWGLVNPGSFNMQAWHLQSGIDAIGSAKTAGGLYETSFPGLQTHHVLRAGISDAIASVPASSEVRAILQAITVADRSGLNSRLWQVFQSYGTSHLLVISGLHVGLVAGIGLLLGKVLQRLSVLSGMPLSVMVGPLMACLLAGLYTVLAGLSIATQRALMMLVVLVVISAAGRTGFGWRSLLVALVIIVALNPWSVVGAGLWLSAGAVALLLWWSDWGSVGNRWRKMVSTHGWMCVAMLPVTGWWFGGGSIAAGFANVFMVPLVGLWVVPLSLLATVAFLSGFESAATLWQLAAAPLETLYPLAESLFTAYRPLFYHHYSMSAMTIAPALAALLLLLLPCGVRVRLGLAVVLLAAYLPGLSSDEWLARLVVLDVGQGTAVVFQSAGRTLVYDTGGGDPAGQTVAATVVLPFLRQSRVQSIDTLVVSHADTDHSAGVTSLVSALPVTDVLAGEPLPNDVDTRSCRAGQSWSWGKGAQFQILAGGDGETGNDSSCVIQIIVGSVRFLLSGDIGAARERELVRYWGGSLASDWLLAAHHGSNTSTSAAWLRHVAPRETVLSHGYANPFGHPHNAVKMRLGAAGVGAVSTAEAGAIEYQLMRDGSLVRVLHRSKRGFWWM